MCDFISVRDRYSYNWIKTLVKDKTVEIWNDPVLLLDEKSTDNKRKAVGINVYFGHEKKYHSGMQKAFVETIKKFRKKCADIPIFLFSSELSDINDIQKVYEHFSEDPLVQIKKIGSSNDLFEFYKTVSAVVATRMHTLITATISGVPATAVTWQGKVSSLMEIIDNKEYAVGVDEFIKSPQTLSDKLYYCFVNSGNVMQRVNSRLETVREQTNKQITKFFNKGE